jgi:ribonuclease HI
MNSDGAFDSSKKEGGWGFAIRDDQGQAVASGAGQEEHLLDAFHAKVLGCLAGLQAAIRLGIMRIIIEVLGRVADRFLPLFSHCGC